jgi:hypothetical protein
MKTKTALDKPREGKARRTGSTSPGKKGKKKRKKRRSKKERLIEEIIALLPDFTRGSLVELRRPCTRESCKACKSGRKHPAHYLSVSVKGKTKLVYVRKDRIERVRPYIPHSEKALSL